MRPGPGGGWGTNDVTCRLGVNPIAWSNDDMRELGGETPLETCLAEARQAGFEGIELGHKFPRESGALRSVLAAHDLALVSGWYSSALLERDAEEEITALLPHLSLLQEMGCSVLVFAETSNAIHGGRSTPLSRSPELSTAAMRRFAERVTRVADHIAAAGLRLAYHHHMGTVVQGPEQIDAFMAAAGESVWLLLDTGHAAFGGADPAALAERHAKRIAHVHCKDLRPEILTRARDAGMSFSDAVAAGVFTVPGDGAVDFDSVLRVLEAAGYDGWLVVEAEQDPAKANPALYARMGCQALRRQASAAGLL